jgi:AraC family transcriptional regulator, activator of mtrCDE
MQSFEILDRVLETMDVAVEKFVARKIDGEARSEAAPLNRILVYRVLHGNVSITIDGQSARQCRSGATILMPPGAALLVQRTGEDAAEVAAALVRARLSGSFGLLDHAKVPIVEHMADDPLVEQLWNTMTKESRATRVPGSTALMAALMKSCLLTVLRRVAQRPGINPRIFTALADPRLSGAVAAILHTPGAPHSVASLADAAGLSRSTFARQFNQALGYPPMEFVGRARLHHAAAMLRSSTTPVKTIAATSGFASRSHFSRSFREVYGCDPSAYRQEYVPVPTQAVA